MAMSSVLNLLASSSSLSLGRQGGIIQFSLRYEAYLVFPDEQDSCSCCCFFHNYFEIIKDSLQCSHIFEASEFTALFCCKKLLSLILKEEEDWGE